MKCKKHYGKVKIITCLSLLIFFCTACNKISSENRLTVGKKGNIDSIIIPENSGKIIQFAATELQEYLEKITGTRLPVIESSAEKTAKAFILSLEEDKDLVWDGFRIMTGSEGIIVNAKEPRGLLYGVYQLLEEAGCAFVYLGEKEEIVPRLPIVEFETGERLFNPVIEHRGLTPYGLQGSSLELGRNFIDWMAKNKLNYILISEDRKSDCPVSAHSSIWKEVNDELLPELQKRGFVIEMAEHTIEIFFPRTLFKKHPEWFALIDGERKVGDENDPYTGQMCYSNKDAVEYYADAVASYVTKHPEYHIIGTWPRDGGQWCECDKCQNDPLVLFHAIERVAQKVKDVNPDIIVENMIYPKPQGFQPPPENLPENMSFLWIPDNGKLDSLGRLWSQQSNRQAQGTYQFEYLMGDNYRSRANVWLFPELAVNNAKHAQNMQFRGVSSLFLPMENWWRACFNNWFFAKACWNTELDVNACLHEYCLKYYGKSAEETEEIFKSIFNELQADESIMIYSGEDDNTQKYEAVKPVASKILEQLNMLIEGSKEPEVIERFKRVKAYVEFFGLYYEVIDTRRKDDLDRLIEYSQAHPKQDMVIMTAEYIKWRNSELFNRK